MAKWCGSGLLGGSLAALLAGAVLSSPAVADDAAMAEARKAAIDAVTAMGEHLRSLESFEIRANIAYDDVVNEDVLIQRNEEVIASVRRPNGLAVSIDGADFHRSIIYDGSQVTIYGANTGLFAQFEAPTTIRETLARAAERHDLEIPFADLFYWGTDEDDLAEIVAAAHVGPAKIGGKLCDQYVFTQEDVSWQIWITQGDEKLPCKITIVDTTQPAKPQYSSVIEVTPNKTFDAATFAFVPPAGARKIQIYTAEATAR